MTSGLPGLPPGLGANIEQDAFNALRLSLISLGLVAGAGEIADVIQNGENAISFQAIDKLAQFLSGPAGLAEEAVGKPLFDLLVSAPAGINLSTAAGAQEAEAVKMVQRMLGFAAALPWVTGQIRSTLKLALGDHAPEPLLESIGKMSEELGVNFFVGTVIERIFETAVSRPLEEAIAEQKRPARLEWPQIRALARQHVISNDELTDRLRKAGFREVDLPLLQRIDDQTLTVSDLQQVAVWRLRDESWIRAKMDEAGLSGENQDVLWDVYLSKSDTAGGNQLRAVAQQAYLNQHITKDDYHALLVQANVPPASIDLELEAADLAIQMGRRQLSTAEIKRMHDDGAIDDAQAQRKLQGNGLSEADAIDVVNDWKVTRTATHPGLTENRILSYLVSGILTPAQAYARLLADGVRPSDATFLVQHPTATSGVRSHGLTENTVISALKDGVIDQGQAEQLLAGLNVAPEEITLRVRSALAVLNRGPKARATQKRLSEAQIIEAMKEGVGTPEWAQRMLVAEGWSDLDAQILVTTELFKLKSPLVAGWVPLT